ncbi:MAG: SHOCT domain-containing protein [Gammaproteobacteria bacterium]|nr:SHOCT domain-containing protein [Gammaproteobacteria bacterium]MBU1654381.1 SHOCT domain-containing protein [Gammaproteobacteria bacterium]MBU1960222.1 SHOCT domain-containing protein [Gammaproteobacteria bacterium]
MFDGHMFGFGGGFMWLFWLLLILLVVWIVSATASSGREKPGKERTALEILEARYARGEIDRDEFEQKKRDLSR